MPPLNWPRKNINSCYCPDLDLLSLASSTAGVLIDLPDNAYPRVTWWKFWERHRTRDEYIKDEHEIQVERRECHIWNGTPFHFCNLREGGSR